MLIGSQHYVFGSDLRRSLYIAEINHVTNQVYMSVKFLFIYKEMLILMYFVYKLHFFLHSENNKFSEEKPSTPKSFEATGKTSSLNVKRHSSTKHGSATTRPTMTTAKLSSYFITSITKSNVSANAITSRIPSTPYIASNAIMKNTASFSVNQGKTTTSTPTTAIYSTTTSTKTTTTPATRCYSTTTSTHTPTPATSLYSTTTSTTTNKPATRFYPTTTSSTTTTPATRLNPTNTTTTLAKAIFPTTTSQKTTTRATTVTRFYPTNSSPTTTTPLKMFYPTTISTMTTTPATRFYPTISNDLQR